MMPTWVKSSYSSTGNGNDCVEVALDLGPGRVGVRDSKQVRAGGAAPVLQIPAAGFAGFLTDVKAGEFDI